MAQDQARQEGEHSCCWHQSHALAAAGLHCLPVIFQAQQLHLLALLSKGVLTLCSWQPKAKRTSTRDVWPWSYLVPWMEEDMARRRVRPGTEGSTGADPYDNSLYMPLAQFVEEHMVQELLHNGESLQVRLTAW